MATPKTPPLLYPSFVGDWLMRFTVRDSDHVGLVFIGPNPPFYPSNPNGGFLTSIDQMGRGSVDFAKEQLTGQFAGDHKQIYFGTWANDEFGGRTGQFCLMSTVDLATGEPLFIGLSETYAKQGSASQEFQVLLGRRKK